MLGLAGIFGNYHVVLSLNDEGKFFQLTSNGYLSCPAKHPHIDVVMRLLVSLSLDYRLVKFVWDPTDGQIGLQAGVWLEDGTLTPSQLTRILFNCWGALDWEYPRLCRTLETGADPGAEYAQELRRQLQGPPGPTQPSREPARVDEL
jgi:hypothetical protein